jgi:hypothetical protein
MANKAIRTEHSGAKHGSGAYWGTKRDAKRESNKARRRGDRDDTRSNDTYEVQS